MMGDDKELCSKGVFMISFSNHGKSDSFSRMGGQPRDEAELNDIELVRLVQERSRRALEVLYERYSARALGLAYKILRDGDLAEEVVVDAFWRVWRRADQFQFGRGSFAAWLYGIVRHLAIDELRRRESRPLPGADEELESASAADATRETDVSDVVARRLLADSVQSALRALPATQREVIHLAYFEGLTRKEISNRLGQPLGTIHTRARLGLDKLRSQLAGVQAGW
jgi:RNA polymerase sigma-70 factor (ECF subfamily)